MQKRQFNLSLEINIEAESPFLAAQTLLEYLQDKDALWQFYVQDDLTREIVSVDFDTEAHDGIVVPVKWEDYKPVIKK